MLSSISSSNQRLPSANWAAILAGSLSLLVAVVGIIELRLALRGFEATVIDSEALWVKERQRASTLGHRAIILVGASRVQLDFDLDVIREKTGLEPVQLAIDGSSFVPVLTGLARDPSITGTVIVGIQDHVIGRDKLTGASERYQAAFERAAQVDDFSFRVLETQLRDMVNGRLRSYADGARPWDSLVLRVLQSDATAQYLTTFRDRSRQADYHKVKMPDFYYQRVVAHLGGLDQAERGRPFDELEKLLCDRIAQLQPSDATRFLAGVKALAEAVMAIQARGGQVIFVAMPTSGLVRAIDQRRYPRTAFWDRLAELTTAETLHFQDIPALAALKCPDGSHLDYRDRENFTKHLLAALRLKVAEN